MIISQCSGSPPCSLYSALDFSSPYLCLPAAPDRVITAGKCPTHLEHSLISWERDGSVYVCVCEGGRTPARFYHTPADPLFKTFTTFSFFKVPPSHPVMNELRVLQPRFKQLLQMLSQLKQRCRVNEQPLKTTLNLPFQQETSQYLLFAISVMCCWMEG